jgi:aldose sugar dehydrogenase
MQILYFSWAEPVAPTDIEFFNSSRLGDRYTNNIFVGGITTGNLYFFEANKNRDGINFSASLQLQESGLSDLVVNNEEELSAITFGSSFGSITDIETGPDGFLYVLSFDNGVIYKISPS